MTSFIDALRDTWTATTEVCATLEPADWEKGTACAGWTVRDQLSHIVGAERSLLGHPAPPPAPEGLPHVLNPLGQLNEAWVVERRGRPGAAVLAEFEEVTAQRLEALTAMTDAELDATTGSPIGPVPYRTFMTVRVMDCWVHEQDIRHALNRHGHLEGPAAEIALDRFVASFGFVVGKRVAPPDGTTVWLDITGPLQRSLAIEMRDGRAVTLDAVPDAPTSWIVTDSEAYGRLVCGRIDGETALQRQRVAFHGDSDIGRRIVDNLATIP